MEKTNEKLSVLTISGKDVNPDGKKSFWHINRSMLPFKLHFFLFIGGMGAVLPYQSALGITKLGLTASNLAAAYTAQQFLFILFKPGIGYLADYFNRLKATIVALTIIQAIFCFFMILIPGADVQSIVQSYESNVSRNEQFNCDLCNRYQDFRVLPAIHSVAEESLRQSCLKYSENYENVEIQCSKQSSFHPTSVNYRLHHRKCNFSLHEDFSLSSSSSTLSYAFSDNVSFITLQINGSQTSSIVCFSSERTPLFVSNSSDDFIGKSCHGISESASAQLQEQFHSSKFKTAKCETPANSVLPRPKDEYNSTLSSANFKTYQFWVFMLCLIVSCTCISSIFTISDTACYESVQGVQGADYGRQRAWGAVSWGIIAPFAGFLNDYTESYMTSWCLMVLLCSLQVWNLSKMNLVKPDFSGSILKDIKTVFSSMEFIAFEIGVFMNGVFTGIIWFYLTWFLTTIGGNKLIIGLAHTVQCFIGEVPMMFFSKWMIEKFGHFNLVSLALISHGIRFLIYSYLYNPWWILPIESLHGFTFGSFYSAMTSYGKLNSKPGIEATTQSVLCTTYEALGAGMGCVISGICFDHYGGHTTFFFASFVCAFSTLINVLFTVLVKCRKGVLNVTKPTIKDRY